MAKNTQPAFDKFELAAFKSAGHNKVKVFLWALALLSGRFRQGKKQLETEDGSMCCLGVLCRINKLERTHHNGLIKYDGSAFWVSPTDILGGEDNLTIDEYPDFSRKNDIEDVSFREIAFFLLRSLFPLFEPKDKRYDR